MLLQILTFGIFKRRIGIIKKALTDCNNSADEWKDYMYFEMLLHKNTPVCKEQRITSENISINMMKVVNYVLTIAQKLSIVILLRMKCSCGLINY